MANKLPWNPPKWKSYNFDGTYFKVELDFEEDKRTAELKMEELAIKLTDADSVDEVLKELFECQATIEKCNIGIRRANDIREYFDAEVE